MKYPDVFETEVGKFTLAKSGIRLTKEGAIIRLQCPRLPNTTAVVDFFQAARTGEMVDVAFTGSTIVIETDYTVATRTKARELAEIFMFMVTGRAYRLERIISEYALDPTAALEAMAVFGSNGMDHKAKDI